MESQDEGSWWERTESVYEHGWEVAVFATGDAEGQYHGHAILERFGGLGEDPEKAFQSIDYSHTLAGSSFGEFLRFMPSTFEG